MLLGIACATTLASRVAEAEPAQASRPARVGVSSSPEKVERAAALYNDGIKAAGEEKWLLAAKYFDASWNEYPHYQSLMNLANAELMAKRHRDSAEHFDRLLRQHSSELSPGDIALTQKKLAETRAHVGTLVVQVNVRGAALMIDQKSVGSFVGSSAQFVDPGPRTVEARLPGYRTARESIDVRAGQNYPLSLKLVREDAAVRQDVKTAPPAADGGERLRRGFLFGGVAAAVAGTASGIVFSILSSVKGQEADDARASLDRGSDPSRPNKNSDCNEKNPFRDAVACEQLGRLEKQQLYAGLAGWSYVVGGAGAIAAVVAWQIGPLGDVRATASLYPGGGGLFVGGRW